MMIFRSNTVGLFLLFLVFASPAWAQSFDLSELLQPLTFPVLQRQSTTGLLQRRLQDVTAQIRNDCARTVTAPSSQKNWICLWPRIVDEFSDAALAIHRSSPDQRTLFTTLAAGLHPFDLDPDFTDRAHRFDVIAPRYLIALRLLRDAWPAVDAYLVQQRISSPLDSAMEPWLTSETSWSFALRIFKNFRCRDLEPACEEKSRLARYLRATLPLIADDPTLERVSRLDSSKPLRLKPLPTEPDTDREELGHLNPFMDSLLNGVFANANNGYLFLLQDPSDVETNIRQVSEYLNHVKDDASRPTRFAMRASGDVCKDIPEIVRLSLKERMPWSRAAQEFPSDCSALRGRTAMVDALDRDGMRYRFHLFHLRTVIGEFYGRNKDLDPKLLARGRYERRLVDVLKVIREVRTFPTPFSEPKNEPARLRWTRPLLEEFYDLVDRLEHE